MRPIDLLTVKFHPYGGGTVTTMYPAEELEPGLHLLKARRHPEYCEWPEIEVKDFDGFTLTLKLALLTEEEFEPFEVSAEEPFTLSCDFGEMTFTLLEEDYEDDDGRWDAYC